jgi:hypothetical protein
VPKAKKQTIILITMQKYTENKISQAQTTQGPPPKCIKQICTRAANRADKHNNKQEQLNKNKELPDKYFYYASGYVLYIHGMGEKTFPVNGIFL